MRVLSWMIDRVEGKGQAAEHMFGTTPRYQDLNWNGVDFTPAQFAQVTSIDREAWQQELVLHDELFTKLRHRLPQALADVRAALGKRLEG